MTATNPGSGPVPCVGQLRCGAAPDIEHLYKLRLRSLWATFTRQPPSFWLVCLYMLFEYVRPQAIYTFLEAIPWAQILILACPVAYLLEGGKFRVRSAIDYWVVAFSIAIGLSWAFAVYPEATQARIFVFINWLMAYFLIANAVTTERRFLLFFCLFLLASLKMSQHGARTWAARGFGFASWGATGAPGWFHNSGEFGIQMCIFLPLSLYFIAALRRYWERWKTVVVLALPLTAVASLIATNSRGAIIGAGAVGIWILLWTRYRFRVLIGLAVATVVVVQLIPEETKLRFATMGEDNTSQSRYTYWRHGSEIYLRYPITGIGYENWPEYYRQYYGRTGLPHNIFIQAAAELGSLGLLALLGLIVSSFLVNHRTRRMARQLGERGRFLALTARGLDGAMIGFLTSAFFVTVLYYPYLWFGLALTSALHAVTAGAIQVSTLPKPSNAGRRFGSRTSGWRSAVPSCRIS